MNSPEIELPDSEPRWHDRLAIFAVAVLTLVAMGRLCGNDFTSWDDQGTVYQNPWLSPPTMQTIVHYWMWPAYGLYIPVTYTLWAAVALIAHVPKDANGISLNPWLFHGTNVICHLLAVLVAYRTLRLLNADAFASACGALLFGVHPIQVEAVAWVSGLKDVLSGLLGMIALWQYVAFAVSDLKGRSSALRYFLATGAFTLAMFAKPSVMALPLAVLAIDRWGVGRPWRKVIPPAAGWLFVAFPLAVIARWVQDASNTPIAPLFIRPLIATDSLAFYMAKLVWPLNLTIDYGRNTTAVLAHRTYLWDWIAPVSIAVFLIAGARRRPVLVACGVIFLAGCLPVLGFTPAMFQYFSMTADHYLYLSLFGPALALAWLLSVRPNILLKLATVAALIVLIALSVHQGTYWQNDSALFTHAIEVNPSSYIGYLNLGADSERAGDYSAAIGLFESAARINPEYAMIWGNLGSALDKLGKTQDAIAATRRAIELQIKYPNLRVNWTEDNEALGQMLFDTGRFAEAVPFLQTASDLQPQKRELAKQLAEAKKRAATQPATDASEVR
jgi:protein O-mannosyl-transferase